MRRQWPLWGSGPAARGAGDHDRVIRLRQLWRGWFRRWVWAVAAGLSAWGLGVWLHAQTWQDHAQARHEVRALQDQLAALPAVRPLADAGPADAAIPALPSTEQRGQMWTRLPDVLAQHRVRLLSMHPVHEPLAAPLASEAMRLRLQARFEDWAGLWAVLTRMGPVWSMDRVRVVHSAQAAGVDIEVVWRIWSRTEGADPLPDGPAFDTEPLHGPGAPAGRAGASVFDEPAPAAGVQAAAQAPPTPVAAAGAGAQTHKRVFTHEPERWPMLPLRVIGIWRHGDQVEAIVANDTHWFRAQEGRQISLEGHRLWRIGPDAVQVHGPLGHLYNLKMEAATP